MVSPARLFFLVLGSFLLAFFLNMRVFNDGSPGWKQIVTSDGRGYYAYLPALLLDHDPTFASEIAREKGLAGYSDYRPGYLVKQGARPYNKYFTGEALLLIPFFLAATLFSWIFATGIDGYSFFYLLFAGLGALCYLMLGLFFLFRILGHLRISPANTVLTLAAIFFGTNLFYYSLWQPTMSHLYSFFLVNGFMWTGILAINNWNLKSAARLGFFFTLAVLTRPTHISILLLVPFLAGNTGNLAGFTKSLLAGRKPAAVFILILVAGITLQCLVWYWQTGHLFIWSYRNEGFRFTTPEITNVLFSYRKGFFIYTPLALLSLAGLFVLAPASRLQFFSVAGFLVLATYVIASWWNWYYGDGFGLRAFIDYYGVFAILLALLLNSIRFKPLSACMWLLLLILTIFNLVQTWQYTHFVIQPNSMNREKYRYVFMRTDQAAAGCLGGNREIADYSIDQAAPVKKLFNDFEQNRPNWNEYMTIATPCAFSGKHCGFLDEKHPYSSGVSIRASSLGHASASFFIEGTVMVYDSISDAGDKAMVVLSMDSITPGINWWTGFRLNDTPGQAARHWRKSAFSLMTPEISNPRGILKVYIWNTGRKPLLVDDFTVNIYGSRQ